MEVINNIYIKSAEHAAQKARGQAPFHALLAIILSYWDKPFHNMLWSPHQERSCYMK